MGHECKCIQLDRSFPRSQRKRRKRLTRTNAQHTSYKHLHANLLSDLPLAQETHEVINSQINETVSELFQAAVAQSIHFQPLPEAFEIYGLDFLVAENDSSKSSLGRPNGDANRASSLNSEERPHVYLLEVNAFPDFAQTGRQLRDLVVKDLWEQVITTIVRPHFNVSENCKAEQEVAKCNERLLKVLDVDMGRG